MPGIINGSILKFQSQVKVPSAGSAFATLEFTDKISDGLAYVQVPATVVEYKDADAAVAAPYTPITDAVIGYVHPDLKIDITNGAVTNPTKDVLVRVTFYVQVVDVTTAINADGNITNTATFTMLNGVGETEGNPATATVEQPMKEFSLHVMGVPVTIQQAADQPFNAVYFFGAMDGEAQTDLSYKLSIYPNVNFDFQTGEGGSTVLITRDSIDGQQITGTTVTVITEATAVTTGLPVGTIVAEIPHNADVSGGVIHVTIPTLSNANVVTAEEPQFIFGDADIIKGAATIASAHKYNVQVNFTDEVKVLTDATKELILS